MKDYNNQILKQALAYPDEDEMEVGRVVIDNGAKAVLFLAPNTTQGANSPDCLIDDLPWEIKTPDRFTWDTLEHAFRTAKKQSENVIFYLKNNKIPDENVIRTLERLFRLIAKAKRLKIIARDRKIVDFVK